MRSFRLVFLVSLLLGTHTAWARSAEIAETTFQARFETSRNGSAVWSVTVQGARIQFIRDSRHGRVTLLAEDRRGRVTAVDITDAIASEISAKESSDDWEVVPIFVNPSTGSGTYGLYRNGAFFGLMIMQPDGTISVVINPT